MKTNPRENTMSFAATQDLKDRIIKEAAHQGLRVSRFVTTVLEEKLDAIAKQNSLQK